MIHNELPPKGKVAILVDRIPRSSVTKPSETSFKLVTLMVRMAAMAAGRIYDARMVADGGGDFDRAGWGDGLAGAE
jgi:hypothetical protein